MTLGHQSLDAAAVRFLTFGTEEHTHLGDVLVGVVRLVVGHCLVLRADAGSEDAQPLDLDAETLSQLLSEEQLRDAIARVFARKGMDIVNANLEAFKLGLETASNR